MLFDSHEHSLTHKLMIILRKFDQEGTGTVSKSQFESLLRAALPLDEILYQEEVDHLWAYFPKRDDGDIENSDLVDWILRPSTPLMLTDAGDLAFFDLKFAIQPLFQVYNQNGDGYVCLHEFIEAHGILQIALQMNPSEEEDPPVLRGDLHNLFVHVIGDSEKRLTLEKFVQWQRVALIHSVLPPDSLKRLLQNVAKQMQRVFKLIAAEKRGDLKESDRLVLTRILGHLAQFSRELWGTGPTGSTGSTGPSASTRSKGHGFSNKWTAPLVGMNVQHLKDIFLHDFSYSRLTFSSKVLRRDWEVLCIPDLPQGRHQDWLARVCLNTLLSPVDPVDQPDQPRQRTDLHTYRYVKESFTWTLDDDCQFDQALNGLSPEVKLFALLKSEGNFGQRLSWSQVQAALSVAVKLGIITQAQVKGCNEKLDDWVTKGMDADGLWCTRETLEVVREKVVTSPSQIMGIFAEMGVFSVTSVWADFMDTEQ